jgi:hypothetical protein
MATMIHHADAIVRDAPKSPEFNEFPKCMAHPGFHPGEIGQEVKSPGGYTHYVGGLPVRFPPVLVSSPDDEEYYAAKGYISQGKSDPAAFARAAAAARPVASGYVPVEYPKWAGGVLVNDADEEAAALAGRRAQLGIKSDADPPEPQAAPASDPVAAISAPADALRIDAMEQQIAEMRQMMAPTAAAFAAAGRANATGGRPARRACRGAAATCRASRPCRGADALAEDRQNEGPSGSRTPRCGRSRHARAARLNVRNADHGRRG